MFIYLFFFFQDNESNEILGQYVDYGNIAKIKCCNLRPLTKEFSNHPCFAIKCSLAGIRPIQDSPLAENSNWSEHAIKVFKELTSDDRCLTAQICNELCKEYVIKMFLSVFFFSMLILKQKLLRVQYCHLFIMK